MPNISNCYDDIADIEAVGADPENQAALKEEKTRILNEKYNEVMEL